jgi:anti-sigma factor RsiW
MSNEHFASTDLHLAAWQDRLQDAVDGAPTSEAAQVHAHITSCALCAAEHRRLLAVDAQLRGEFAGARGPSVNFDQRLFARIAAAEQDERAHARQRELREHQARLAQIRGNWREFSRFQFGNVVGAIATVIAIGAALGSLWPTSIAPTVSNRLTQLGNGLPHSFGLSTISIAVILGSITVAGIAMWYAKTSDRGA